MTNFSEPLRAVDADTDLTSTQGEAVWMEKGFTALVWVFALITVILLFWMCWEIVKQALPAIQKFGLPFLWNQTWNIDELNFGALPFVYGTLVTSGLALLLAVPMGLAVALVTSEDFLPLWVRSPVGFMVELIAAIPSVIVGLWGIFVLIPILLPFQQFLFNSFPWIPLFSISPAGPSLMTAGIVLGIMILPTIAAISREVLLALPQDLRSASMSLGATRWETIWKVLLPTCISGIIGAVILGLGRALGETMAVTMVIGNSIQVTPSLLDAGISIPAALVNQFAEAADPLQVGALMYLSLILLVITLVVNIIAMVMVQLIGGQGMGFGDLLRSLSLARGRNR